MTETITTSNEVELAILYCYYIYHSNILNTVHKGCSVCCRDLNGKNFLHGADELLFFTHETNPLPISRV